MQGRGKNRRKSKAKSPPAKYRGTGNSLALQVVEKKRVTAVERQGNVHAAEIRYKGLYGYLLRTLTKKTRENKTEKRKKEKKVFQEGEVVTGRHP